MPAQLTRAPFDRLTREAQTKFAQRLRQEIGDRIGDRIGAHSQRSFQALALQHVFLRLCGGASTGPTNGALKIAAALIRNLQVIASQWSGQRSPDATD